MTLADPPQRLQTSALCHHGAGGLSLGISTKVVSSNPFTLCCSSNCGNKAQCKNGGIQINHGLLTNPLRQTFHSVQIAKWSCLRFSGNLSNINLIKTKGTSALLGWWLKQ